MSFRRYLLVALVCVSVLQVAGCGPRPIASGEIINVVYEQRSTTPPPGSGITSWEPGATFTRTLKWDEGSVEIFQDVVVVTDKDGKKFVAPRAEFSVLELK